MATADTIIAVHNHPWGDPNDVRPSRNMNATGKPLDISVLDHVIVGFDRYASMRARGLMEGMHGVPTEGGGFT